MNCKKLSNKGFSLIEILVAVSIIGIISAIAIPGFQNYRKDAAKVAGDTSIRNVEASYTNCTVLKKVSECDSMNELGVSCQDCEDKSAAGKLCIEVSKEVGGDDFKACYSVDTTVNPHSIKKHVGGSLLKEKVCHEDNYTTSWQGYNSNATTCTEKADCGTDTPGQVANGHKRFKCDFVTNRGTCQANICT